MTYRILQYQKEVLEKGKAVPVNLVHGEEEFLVRTLIEKLKSLYGDNTTVVWGDDVRPEDVYNLLSEGSMFSAGADRAVVVLRAEEFFKKLRGRRALSSFTGTLGKLKRAKLFLVFSGKLTPQDLAKEPLKTIAKMGHVIAADRLSPAKVKEMVRRKLEREAGGVEEEALNLLVDMCGGNLTVLRQEVEKLIAYAAGEKITPRMVREVCSPWESYTVFDFIDSFMKGNLEGSLRALEDSCRKGIPALQIQSTLASYALRLYTLHRLLSRGKDVEKALDSLGVRHSFLRMKLKGYLESFPQKRLRDLVLSLHRLDADQKLRFVNPETSLRNFTIDFLRSAYL